MNDIALPIGKIIKAKVISPIKASKDYAKAKIILRKYEKQTNVIPLSKLKRKCFHLMKILLIWIKKYLIH